MLDFSKGKKIKQLGSFYGENVDLWFIEVNKSMYKRPFITDSMIKSRKKRELSKGGVIKLQGHPNKKVLKFNMLGSFFAAHSL